VRDDVVRDDLHLVRDDLHLHLVRDDLHVVGADDDFPQTLGSVAERAWGSMAMSD
jgi:hypothetical protein